MKLEETIDALAVDIAFWLEGVVDPDTPIEDLGTLCLEVSEKLRSLGIILLTTNADSAGFCRNLVRSGRAWRTYLDRVRLEGAVQEHHYCTGRFEPLIDAIVAGDFLLAQEIGRLSPADWRKGHEYEDDYCFGRFLQLASQVDPSQTQVASVITRFEQYVGQEWNARLSVLQSIMSRDQAAFDDAFQSLLDARALEIEERKANGQLEEPVAVAQRRVFVEGLAILRIAEARGFATAAEYDLCPSIARGLSVETMPEDVRPEMDGWLS